METEEQARAREDLMLGTRLGGYEIEILIGKGAMGNVYRARQISLERPVAIKLLIPYLASQPELLARFFREAKAAASINHPNLVQVYDFGEVEGTYFYVMELIEGHSLGEYLRRAEVFGESECIGIARQTTAALQAAHRSGIVHRDVKPDNLMLNRSGQIKLSDLGLARVLELENDQSLTMTGMSIGTPFYISPEQVRGERQIDQRTDFYALGATLFHLSTGQVPFTGETSAVVMARHLHDTIPWVRDVNPALSDPFAALLHRLMAKSPDERPASHEEVFAELDACEAGDGTPQPARSPVPGGRRASGARRSRGGWLWRIVGLAVVFVLLAALALGFLVWRRGSSGRSSWTAVAQTASKSAQPVTLGPFTAQEMLDVRGKFEERGTEARKDNLELKVPYLPAEVKHQWLGPAGEGEPALRPGNALWLSWDLSTIKKAFANQPEGATAAWYREVLPKVWVQRAQLIVIFRGVTAPGQLHLYFSPGPPSLDQSNDNLVGIVPVEAGRAQAVAITITDRFKSALTEETQGGWLLRYVGKGRAALADLESNAEKQLLGPRIEVCTVGAQGRDRGLLPFLRKPLGQQPHAGGREGIPKGPLQGPKQPKP